MKDTFQMLQDLVKVLEYQDLPEFEVNFITDLDRITRQCGNSTTSLSGKQVDKIQQLWERRVK